MVEYVVKFSLYQRGTIHYMENNAIPLLNEFVIELPYML